MIYIMYYNKYYTETRTYKDNSFSGVVVIISELHT